MARDHFVPDAEVTADAGVHREAGDRRPQLLEQSHLGVLRQLRGAKQVVGDDVEQVVDEPLGDGRALGRRSDGNRIAAVRQVQLPCAHQVVEPREEAVVGIRRRPGPQAGQRQRADRGRPVTDQLLGEGAKPHRQQGAVQLHAMASAARQGAGGLRQAGGTRTRQHDCRRGELPVVVPEPLDLGGPVSGDCRDLVEQPVPSCPLSQTWQCDVLGQGSQILGRPPVNGNPDDRGGRHAGGDEVGDELLDSDGLADAPRPSKYVQASLCQVVEYS